MHTQTAKLMILIAGLSVQAVQAETNKSTGLIEVPVQRVFFPTQGYDDNDNIQVIIEGELPDPCYVLGKQTISRGPSGKVTIRQFAWRRESTVCNSGDLLEEGAYSEEVSLGRLSAGTYQVNNRNLKVDVAPVSSLDNLNYARVTGLLTRDVVLTSGDVQITISGTLGSSCDQIKEPIDVQRQGDTIVIRPIEVRVETCERTPVNFEKTIQVGKLPQGEYLVHVRAKNGKALQRTFDVMNNDRE